MRNESTSSSTRTAHAQPTHPSHGKPEATHDQEAVQRFRKLMDGRVSGRSDDAARDEEAGGEQDDRAAAAPAGKLALDQQKALYALLQQQLSASEGKSALTSRDDEGSDDGDDDSAGSHDGSADAGAGLLWAGQAAPPMQAPQAQANVAAQNVVAPALAELIERHVKQLLIPDATSRSAAQSREIMITLKDGLLPDTQLWLSRTPKGWRLRADTRSADAYRSLVDHAPQLIERFAEGKLGELEVDPSLLS